MLRDSGPGVEEILTEQEIQSLRLAQEVYGARAKAAASHLAETLGLESDVSSTFVGGVAVRLEGLDFEQRRSIAKGFEDLSLALGGAAVNGSERIVTLDFVRGQSQGEATVPAALESTEEASVIASSIERNGAAPVNSLGRQQRSWLLRVYEEDDVGIIDSLSMEQRLSFISELTRNYQALKIPRLGPDAKRERSEQLLALMSGRSYREIAGDLGIQENTLSAGLIKMTGSIKTRIPYSQLKSLIPAPGNVAEESAKPIEGELSTGAPKEEAAASDNEASLNAEQQEWLDKLFEPEAVASISQLSEEQLTEFAKALAGKYLTLKINRLEAASKQRRADIMVAFLGEKSSEEIAKEFGMMAYALRNELKKIADNIIKRVPRPELDKLLSSADEAVGGEQAELRAELSLANSEEPAELSKIQRRWLNKIFEEEDLDTIQKLTRAQRDFLSERLGRRINAAVIKTQGPSRTSRRLQEVTLLMSGNSYEQIAALTGMDISTVKQELHHSAVRLSATTPKPVLKNILNDATLHTEE